MCCVCMCVVCTVYRPRMKKRRKKEEKILSTKFFIFFIFHTTHSHNQHTHHTHHTQQATPNAGSVQEENTMKKDDTIAKLCKLKGEVSPLDARGYRPSRKKKKKGPMMSGALFKACRL